MRDLKVSATTANTASTQWSAPLFPNGPIEYYEVRFWPKGQEELSERVQTPDQEEEIKVDCSIVDGATFFTFVVYAYNEFDGSLLQGRESVEKDYEMCNIHQGELDLNIIL